MNPEVRSKGKNSTFSEYGHVAYKMKGNNERSNTQAHILSLHAPSTPVWGQRPKHFFSESSHVALSLFWNGAPCKHIFYPKTYPRPLEWGQKIKK